MEANAKSANGGFNGEGIRVEDCVAKDQASTKTLEECRARVQASKKNPQAEKRRKDAERKRTIHRIDCPHIA
jgi:hypothetical protein